MPITRCPKCAAKIKTPLPSWPFAVGTAIILLVGAGLAVVIALREDKAPAADRQAELAAAHRQIANLEAALADARRTVPVPPSVVKPAAWQPRTEQRITRENYEKVENGLSLRSVEKILGPGKELQSIEEFTTVVWKS